MQVIFLNAQFRFSGASIKWCEAHESQRSQNLIPHDENHVGFRSRLFAVKKANLKNLEIGMSIALNPFCDIREVFNVQVISLAVLNCDI